MPHNPKDDNSTETSPMRLLSSSSLGQVSMCPAGCVHIDTDGLSLRLTQKTYTELVAMLSRAASEMTDSRDVAVH